jgi:O-antigen ligase
MRATPPVAGVTDGDPSLETARTGMAATRPEARRAGRDLTRATTAEPLIAIVPFAVWFIGGVLGLNRVEVVAYLAVGALLVVRPALGLLAMVPFLPFAHTTSFQPHGPMVLLTVVGLGSVGARIAAGRASVPSSLRPAAWVAFALLAATTFQLMLGVRTFGRSIPLAALSQYDQTLILLGVLLIALVALPGRNVVPYTVMAVGSLAIVAAVGVIHFVDPGILSAIGLGWLVRPDTLNYRASGVIASPNFLGFAMAAGVAWLVVRFAWWLRARDGGAGWLTWAVPLFGIAMLLAFSRAAIAALAAGVIVAAVRWSPRIGIALAGVAIALAVVVYPLFIDARLSRTFDGAPAAAQAELAESDQARGLMARAAFDAFVDAPIAGHGFSTFSTISPRYSGQSVLTSAHNEYLKLAAEQGIVGVVLFVGLLAALVLPIWRAGFGPWTASLAVATVFAVFSLTADSMSNAQAASGTFLFLALGAVEAAAALESNRPAGPRVRRSQATRGSQATPMR